MVDVYLVVLEVVIGFGGQSPQFNCRGSDSLTGGKYMPKTKPAIWLCPSVNQVVEDKARVLRKLGFTVDFASTADELLTACDTQRTPYIFISDSIDPGNEETVLAIINRFTSVPDIKAAKFLLVCELFNSRIITHACANAFRGIVSLHLSDKEWETQIQFITSMGQARLEPQAGLISLHHLCSIRLPARVVWISRRQIRIECSVNATVGQSLTLVGSIATALGRRQLTLPVATASANRLVHRFARAYELDLASQADPRDIETAIQSLSPKFVPPPLRIFAVIKSQGLRRLIVNTFRSTHYDLTLAIQIKNISHEPSFLAPDMIVVEDHFATSRFSEVLSKMVESLPKETAVLVIADDPQKAAEIPLETTVINRSELTSQRLIEHMPDTQTIRERHHLAKGDAVTYAQVILKGGVRALHPRQIEITTQQAIHPYAHCQVSTPMIDQALESPVWCKLRSTYRNPSVARKQGNLFVSEGYLCAVPEQKVTALANILVGAVAKQLEAAMPPPPVDHEETDEDEEDDILPISKRQRSRPTPRPLEAPASDVAASTFETSVSPPRARPRRGYKTSRREPSHDVLRYLGIAVVLMAIGWLFVTVILPFAARDLERSGRVFTDQLKAFQDK